MKNVHWYFVNRQPSTVNFLSLRIFLDCIPLVQPTWLDLRFVAADLNKLALIFRYGICFE